MWISLAIAILQLIVKLPDIIATLERIFGKWKSARLKPLQVAKEVAKLHKAVEAKLAQVNDGAASLACPLLAYEGEFDTRHVA